MPDSQTNSRSRPKRIVRTIIDSFNSVFSVFLNFCILFADFCLRLSKPFTAIAIPVATVLITYFQWEAAKIQSDYAQKSYELEVSKNEPFFAVTSFRDENGAISFEIEMTSGSAKYVEVNGSITAGLVAIKTKDGRFISCRNQIFVRPKNIDNNLREKKFARYQIEKNVMMYWLDEEVSNLSNEGVDIRRKIEPALSNLFFDFNIIYTSINNDVKTTRIESNNPWKDHADECKLAIRTEDDSRADLNFRRMKEIENQAREKKLSTP